MDRGRPFLIVVAGPNGSGKSSLTRHQSNDRSAFAGRVVATARPTPGGGPAIAASAVVPAWVDRYLIKPARSLGWSVVSAPESEA